MKIKNEHKYVNAFNLIPGIGPQKLYLIAQYFETFEQAWRSKSEELKNANLTPKLIENISEARKTIDPDQEFQRLQDEEIEIITIQDEQFPKNLKTITSPPFVLYVRGNLDLLKSPSIAVVGSRKISDYGKHAITTIIRDIAKSGITIVSGLALGTDALAHRETLDASGTTIAVLGGGIDDKTITPRSHINLANQILDNGGAIISEYPIGIQPNRGTFPARNRIMAGLTTATVIIESTAKSGTLITAQHAHKFKRNLFALPGSIFTTNSVGPNMLIREGKAKALLCSDDIKDLFKDVLKDTSKSSGRTCPSTTLTEHQKMLFETIKKHPDGVNINTIIKETKLDGSTISSELTMMEIDGIVKNIGNQTYIVI
ncbi:MAG: DNA-processing protein DprA [Candidatus Moraniibacteriota bacterium]|jgi:DNA processing protein